MILWILATAVVGCGAKYSALSLSTSLYELEQANALQFAARSDINGDSHKAYVLRLVRFARSQGLSVVFAREIKDEDGVVYDGYYDRFVSPKTIYVDLDLAPNAIVGTLAHELAHHFQPMPFDGRLNQVFAEAVSIGYCQRIGLKDWQSSYWYIHQFSVRYAALEKYAKEIDNTVKLFVDATK